MAKCATGALTYFPDGQSAVDIAAYGRDERLHMVYEIEGKPRDFSLPEPVPLNTVTSFQVWNWLIGLIPGAVLISWLWKNVEDWEKNHE